MSRWRDLLRAVTPWRRQRKEIEHAQAQHAVSRGRRPRQPARYFTARQWARRKARHRMARESRRRNR